MSSRANYWRYGRQLTLIRNFLLSRHKMQNFLLHCYNMKLKAITCYSSNKKLLLLLLPLSLLLLTLFPLNHITDSHSSLPSPGLSSLDTRKECDIFKGSWVPFPQGPYYTTESCSLIIDQQNCVKLGRPDAQYMKWRWRPQECELPYFNANQFLELVRGKSMAFVGDSVGRNQMQSLLCLLAQVAHAEDVSHRYASDTTYFKRWFYADYGFTLATLWSPFLVNATDADPSGHSYDSIMALHLDQPDEGWASQVENFDFVIVSGGQWFFRPLMYYMNGQVLGCHKCNTHNITELTMYTGYRMAFRTVFKTLLDLKYKGITFLRTYSPSHFENGQWNTGGNCNRTMPFTNLDKVDGYNTEMYLTQVEEFRTAQKAGRKRGLKFELLATTEVMLLRPDAHPDNYGNTMNGNVSVSDCVHWCLPGAIDTWNEFLFYMLRKEATSTLYEKQQKKP